MPPLTVAERRDRRASAPGDRPEVWAGVECTVNRVGDAYFDQVERTGHGARPDDLDRLASLGATAVRYPVLWERTAPDGVATADWRWADARLARLRGLGLRPIVGLVHHGSGPRETSLLDPAFPEKLARYARAVVERYPWVDDWTPVNEPMTTARFAALYGLWYPHRRDIGDCLRALLNQCRGIALAMRAIRAVNPRARLVQTEDFGRVASPPELAYQADYENRRRLLALDVLIGGLTRDHPLWRHFADCGVAADDLDALAAEPTPIDVVGINYYLTSDRFLDHRLERYPPHTHGGNGRERYADVEAVRVEGSGVVGHAALIAELWARYGLPLAITEVHAGCTREEQLRWVAEAWRAACDARAAGVDVHAVTAWSAFGAFGWDGLLVRGDGAYETGLFDVRTSPPRPTALAHFFRALARDGVATAPGLGVPGWWRRPDRVLYPEPGTTGDAALPSAAPLLVTGATGTLGRAFARIARRRGLPCHLLSRAEMDIADPASVAARLETERPWAVVNAAGYVRVDDAERDRERCWRENVVGPSVLAAACRERGIAFVTFSSDLVFNGRACRPYRESEPVDPLGTYGASKAAAERAVLEALASALVVRTSAFFGPWDEYNFAWTTLAALRAGRAVRAADDVVVSATYVPDLVHAALDLLIDGEHGVWHLANDGALSWAELARRVALAAKLDPSLVEPCPAATFGWPAARPAFSALGSERGPLLRPVEEALAMFLHERAAS